MRYILDSGLGRAGAGGGRGGSGGAVRGGGGGHSFVMTGGGRGGWHGHHGHHGGIRPSRYLWTWPYYGYGGGYNYPYYYPAYVEQQQSFCVTQPNPIPACAGTLYWRGTNTICCQP